MEDIKTHTDSLADKIGSYIETYMKLIGVTTTKKMTGIASLGIISVFILFLCMFILFFLGIGVALWVGEALNNEKAGYFIVAGFYVMCMTIILILRKELIFPFIRNYIIKKVYE
jgi:hypothetical protein